MTSDLTSALTVAAPRPAANTATDFSHHMADSDSTLYVSEEFAQLLEEITAAGATVDTDGGARSPHSSQPGPVAGASRPGLVSWAPAPISGCDVKPTAP